MEEVLKSEKLLKLVGDEPVQCMRCSICLEYFERPVILTCGHTFCSRCIKDTADYTLSRHPSRPPWHVYVDCPHCRKPTNAYQASQKHLPVNYTVSSLVRALRQKNVPTMSNMSTNTEQSQGDMPGQSSTEDIPDDTFDNVYVYDVERLDKMRNELDKVFSDRDSTTGDIIKDSQAEIEEIRKAHILNTGPANYQCQSSSSLDF